MKSVVGTDPRHYFKELRLQQFRSLVALAHWRTFVAAAEALKITRASVWQQLRSLEKELDCALLHTRAHRVELTPAGHRLVEIAAPLVAGFDSARTALHAAIGKDLPQTLTLTASPGFLMYELRKPITRIRAEYPHLRLFVLERVSAEAVELLERGDADLAIASRPAHVAPRPALEYTPITTYPFTIICRPDHPLLRRKKINLRALVSHPLVISDTSTYSRQVFDAVVERAGLAAHVNISVESNFPVLLFEYVRLGLGVALLALPPRVASIPPWRGREVVLRSVEHLFGAEPIYYVRRKGCFETPHAVRFRQLVTSRARSESSLPAGL